MFEFDFEHLEDSGAREGLSITVNGLDGTEYQVWKLQGSTVKELKVSLEELHGIPVFEQRLCLDSRELRDEVSLDLEHSELQLLRSAANEEEWLEKIRQNPFALCEAPVSIKASRDVVREAAAKEVSALAYADEALRGDEEFGHDLVSRDGFALRYLSANLQAKREIVLAAVQSAGSVLRHAGESLKADSEIVLAAVRQDAKALMHADLELLHDTDFTMQAMATNRLVADYLMSLTLDGRRSEEQRAAEEAWETETDLQDSGLPLDRAHSYFQRGDAVFLDSRSVDEFDRGHIVGALSFSERSPLLRRLIQQREDLEHTANPVLKQLLRFPHKLVIIIVYSDSGSDDLSLGYISRCVRVTQELRRICRQQPSLGNEKRILRLIGGLNHWKRAGCPVNGDERPLINNHVLYEGGIHGYLNIENDI
ncbi:unnamed protein product [Durusdinium trenchii]|uniref:Uncharacterized protein n=2 Tax=Durusdinium trenchii TaxID=1381693 RepID=A0ABP0QI37_9DINO